jgi:hypothetical protein
MQLFRFAMQDFDVIPTLGTELVAVMHYLEPDGSITLIFAPGSSVEQILIQFSEAISKQPTLNTEYLLHHSWLPSNYFAGALLLDDLHMVLVLPLFIHVCDALESRYFWGSQGKLVLFLYLVYHHLLNAVLSVPPAP